MAMETALVAVRFWSSVLTDDDKYLEVEFEFPAYIVKQLDRKAYSSFEFTLNKTDTYVFHKIDLSGEIPVIDVVPRLN